MKHLSQNKIKMGISTIVTVLLFVGIQSTLTGCAATAARKPSGVASSQAATDIWHSYQILPNYKYYYSGPDARPFYIIGIDDRYRLKSNLWKPVDLTPQRLEKWINIPPRVGYSPRLYGADITDSSGQRIGLWYSVRDWRLLGSASVGENNQVTVTIPVQTENRKRRRNSAKD
jgi:hypothetical protein